MWGTNKKNEEFVPSGIRNITPHFIHHSKGLTVPFLVVFHEESRGYDPESISQSYDLCWFFQKAIWDPEGGKRGPRGQTMRFLRLDHIILRSFLVSVHWSTPQQLKANYEPSDQDLLTRLCLGKQLIFQYSGGSRLCHSHETLSWYGAPDNAGPAQLSQLLHEGEP